MAFKSEGEVLKNGDILKDSLGNYFYYDCYFSDGGGGMLRQISEEKALLYDKEREARNGKST